MGFANFGPRNCLLSRKRKLTELYYATVGFEAATADPLYQQKEQAFLDANDLAKYVHSLSPSYRDFSFLVPFQTRNLHALRIG